MNDERPIEKLLRRYAKKRGDEAGAPPTLHPATRRLLQGEVARQFPKPESASKGPVADFFALLSRRWIYAAGVFAILCVAAAVILPSLTRSKDTMLAQSSPSEELARLESLPAPVASAPAVAPEVQNEPKRVLADGGNLAISRDESVRLDRYAYAVTNSVADLSIAGFSENKKDADAGRKLEESASVPSRARVNSAPPTAAPMTVQPSTRSAGETVAVGALALSDTAKPADLADRRQAATAPPVAPTSTTPAFRSATDKEFLARGGGVEKDAARVYSQSFTSVGSDQLKAKAAKTAAIAPSASVLARFQIEQAGNQLRVIDSDGSTYLGEMNATPANFAGGGGAAGKEQAATYFKNSDQLTTQAPASAVPLAKQQTMNYQWRVEGTNRTLNQNVVFTWNFVETNSLAVSQLPSSATQLPVQFPAQLQNSLIYGRAQLGVGREIEINAAPVKP